MPTTQSVAIIALALAGCYVEPAQPSYASDPQPSQGGEANIVVAETPAPDDRTAAVVPTAPAGQPIQCSANDTIVLDGVTIDAGGGAAVTASGNCTVRLTNCTLRGDVVIVASGNANVSTAGCQIAGDITASGNANVHLQGSAHDGQAHASGNADIHR